MTWRHGVSTPVLRPLRPALKHWCKIVNPVEWWKADRDVPWWYNERASVSLLAGAIWKSGGWCFEEFIMPGKKSKSGSTKHRRSSGRGDLQFEIGGCSSTFVAEAKQCYPLLKKGDHDVKRALKTIKSTLGRASEDASCLPDWGYPVAIAFVAPKVAVAEMVCRDDRLQSLVAEIRTWHDTAVAWTFPERPSHPVWHGLQFPGAMVFLRKVSR
jgi:hypothetical protein